MKKFIPDDQRQRITNYHIYQQLFDGQHFDSFNIKTENQLQKAMERLRYLSCDYPGMISTLAADFLFEEFPKITTVKGENDAFIDALLHSNYLKTQIYESGLENSYRGDVIFRIRMEDGKLIIEDLNPTIYFPEYDRSNVRRESTSHSLAWEMKIAEKPYIFEEKHLKGSIENHFYEKEPDGTLKEVGLDLYNSSFEKNVLPIEQTGVEDFLVVHIKNYGTNNNYFGISDYKKLTSLFYAINNRLTKIDNILDSHGDPILAVPEGVIDEDGKVRKDAFGLIEVPPTDETGGGLKPEYIVWDAKLESAFSQIDNLVEMIFMFSDTSKALFGKDKEGGQAESGRALKYRLLRTLAKKHRKQLYYDDGLKKLFYTAQEFAKANNLEVEGERVKKKPSEIQIEWEDGIINDALEQLELEERKVDSGFTSKVEAIMRLENISREEAEEKVATITEEKKANMENFSLNQPNFNNDDQL